MTEGGEPAPPAGETPGPEGGEPAPSAGELAARARAWMAGDPDPGTRAEVAALLDRDDREGLAERFGGRLTFGTAGLRGPLGAGPNRMNRAVVRATTAGLARYLLDRVPGAAGRGVVVGYDARHLSDAFAADAVSVLAGAGLRAYLLPRPLPTPVLAFSVRHLGAAAGVMVTASHNPAPDNGYKVYLGDGAQLVPPADRLIAAAAAAATPGAVLAGIPLAATPSPAGRAAIPLAPSSSPLVARLDDGVVDAYMDAVARLAPDRSARRVSIVYTAMHGVGAETLLRLFERAGFPPPHLVTEQAEPDPDFPTLAFPNPEEPGALDLALAEARRVGADLVIANDPDADRLAVAVPDASPTGWRALTGDELGVLLADHVLASGEGDDRLVATTVVSSSMLEHLARAAGVHHARTLTGFKWIVRAAERRPGTRFVYGYEEALGYAVGDVVRDKDGLSAALVVAELAALERRRGRTLGDRIEALSRRFGLHATAQWSARLDGPGARAAMAGAMAGLRASPPASIGDRSVTAVEDLSEGRGDLPPADVLTFRLDGGARVVVRPSGTEPKLKAYLEVVLPVAAGRPVGEVRAEAARQLGELRAGLGRVTGLL